MDYFAAIRTFVRASDLGSLTKAAQELSIKTSTASRHVKDLEADLRIALFNRSTRGLSLTEGGKVFYSRVSEILEQLDDAKDATSALNRTPSGVLRVTMPYAFGRLHVMPYLKAFADLYPGIDVDVVFCDEVMNLIESKIDVGIRIGTLGDSSLMARRLAPEQHRTYAAPSYIRDHGMPVTPAALTQHQCVLYSRAVAGVWQAKALGDPRAAWQKVDVTGRLATNDTDAILRAVLDGAGIGLLPGWLVHDDVTSGKLTPVLADWDMRYRREDVSVWAVYPPKKTVSSKVRSFIDFLAGKYGDTPPWDR